MSGWIGPKMPTHYIDFAKATPEKPGMSDMEKIVAFENARHPRFQPAVKMAPDPRPTERNRNSDLESSSNQMQPWLQIAPLL
jgi:hypothetical protein